MKNHAKRDPKGARDEILLKKLQDLITEHLPVKKNQLPTVDACVKELLKFQEHNRMVVRSSISQENLMNVYSRMKQMLVFKFWTNSQILLRLIFNILAMINQ